MRGELRDQALAACRASVFSVANLYFAFWIPSGYFDASSELNPVLHMWSLAVEEQFYLIWPLCLMGLVRIKREAAFAILFGVIAVSTLCGQLLFKIYPNVVYYTLLTRAGELLVGGLLAFSPMMTQAFAANRILAEAGGIVGMLMVDDELRHRIPWIRHADSVWWSSSDDLQWLQCILHLFFNVSAI